MFRLVAMAVSQLTITVSRVSLHSQRRLLSLARGLREYSQAIRSLTTRLVSMWARMLLKVLRVLGVSPGSARTYSSFYKTLLSRSNWVSMTTAEYILLNSLIHCLNLASLVIVALLLLRMI